MNIYSDAEGVVQRVFGQPCKRRDIMERARNRCEGRAIWRNSDVDMDIYLRKGAG